jgi:5-formyltetrahydrofolate cyclo-ligase
MGERQAIRRLPSELRRLLRAETTRHQVLRARLAQLAAATLLVWAAFTVAVFFLERHAPGTDIHNAWQSAYWTASQMSTIGTSYANPTRWEAHVLDLALKVYAVIIGGTLAGAVGAFFLHPHKEAT